MPWDDTKTSPYYTMPALTMQTQYQCIELLRWSLSVCQCVISVPQCILTVYAQYTLATLDLGLGSYNTSKIKLKDHTNIYKGKLKHMLRMGRGGRGRGSRGKWGRGRGGRGRGGRDRGGMDIGSRGRRRVGEAGVEGGRGRERVSRRQG